MVCFKRIAPAGVLCPVSCYPKNAFIGWTNMSGVWCFLYKGSLKSCTYRPPKINVKPPLEKFIGDQSNTKLGEDRNTRAKEGERGGGQLTAGWLQQSPQVSNGSPTPMPTSPSSRLQPPIPSSFPKCWGPFFPEYLPETVGKHHCMSSGQRGQPPAVLSWWHQQGSPEKQQAHLPGERHI